MRHAARGQRALRLGRVDAACFYAECDARAEEELCAGASVKAAIREVVWSGTAEIEAGITPQNKDRHPIFVERIADDARRPDNRRQLAGRHARYGGLEQRFDFETNLRVQGVREPRAASGFPVETGERLIVFRKRPEQSHLVAARVLRRYG